jgi:hypothetical protein
LRGTISQDFNTRVVDFQNSWASTYSSTLINDSCEFSQSNFPLPGQVYGWTPLVCEQPTLSIIPSSTTNCPGQTVTLTVVGAESFTWSTGANTNSIIVSPMSTTIYTVTGENSTCSTFTTFQHAVSNCTDIQNPAIRQLTSKIYPIPFDLSFILENTSDDDLEFRLTDINGKKFADGHVKKAQKHIAKVDELAPGVYFITIVGSGAQVTQKLIKN